MTDSKKDNTHKAFFAKPSETVQEPEYITTPEDHASETPTANVTQLYLKEIGFSPLLSADEEQDLARKIADGDKEAWDKMITSNLRLVIRIAKYYNKKTSNFMDLVAEGNLGLITAVKKFNPDLGFRFSTYATWWIRQHIEHSLITQTRTIRVPNYIQRELKKYMRVSVELSQQLDRPPSHQEIAKEMDVSVDKLHQILQHTQFLASIDDDNDEKTSVIEKISSEEEDNPSEITIEDDTSKNITRWLNQLDEQQKQVIMLRFGLGDHDAHTLEDTADTLEITREKVRQIQMKALQKLKQITKDEKRSRHDDA